MDAITWRPYPRDPKRSGWFMGPRCVDRSIRRLIEARLVWQNWFGGKPSIVPGNRTFVESLSTIPPKKFPAWKLWTSTKVIADESVILKPETMKALEKMVNDKLEQDRKNQPSEVSLDGLRSGGLSGSEDGTAEVKAGFYPICWWPRDHSPRLVHGGSESGHVDQPADEGGGVDTSLRKWYNTDIPGQ